VIRAEEIGACIVLLVEVHSDASPPYAVPLQPGVGSDPMATTDLLAASAATTRNVAKIEMSFSFPLIRHRALRANLCATPDDDLGHTVVVHNQSLGTHMRP
jgi:hypothetical protein